MRHIVICGLSGSTIFFYIISITVRFSKEKNCKVCFLIFCTNPVSKKNWAWYYEKCILLNFSPNFRNILKYQISRKSVRWGPILHTDRHDEANSRYSDMQWTTCNACLRDERKHFSKFFNMARKKKRNTNCNTYIFLFKKVPRRSWNVYWQFFPRGQHGWHETLTTRFHPVPKLRTL